MPKRFEYSSMDNKPLQNYKPDAHRSRNAQSDPKMKKGNTSSIKFSSGLNYDPKRQFYTTHGLEYTGQPQQPISNPGILAEQYKINREKRVS